VYAKKPKGQSGWVPEGKPAKEWKKPGMLRHGNYAPPLPLQSSTSPQRYPLPLRDRSPIVGRQMEPPIPAKQGSDVPFTVDPIWGRHPARCAPMRSPSKETEFDRQIPK
jgi:hypothetical protein